jgi:tyrosine-protein phosphatase SIW14
MRNLTRFLLAAAIVGFLIAAPIAYKRRLDRDSRNFHVVEPGILYRSGQLPIVRLQQVIASYGIRTVVCLRNGNDPVDQTEEDWVKSRALGFFRIPHRPWVPDQTGKVPAEIGLQAFRDIMDDPSNYPVLVHCFAGVHRTGTMCAMYRMDYQGWSNAEAMAEMRLLGYSILDDHEDVHTYLTNYHPNRRTHSAKQLLLPIVPVSRSSGDRD